jgi:hypothetical protein
VGVILLLQLLYKLKLMSSMRSEQTSHRILREIATDPTEECGDLVRIRSIVGLGRILPASE